MIEPAKVLVATLLRIALPAPVIEPPTDLAIARTKAPAGDTDPPFTNTIAFATADDIVKDPAFEFATLIVGFPAGVTDASS